MNHWLTTDWLTFWGLLTDSLTDCWWTASRLTDWVLTDKVTNSMTMIDLFMTIWLTDWLMDCSLTDLLTDERLLTDCWTHSLTNGQNLWLTDWLTNTLNWLAHDVSTLICWTSVSYKRHLKKNYCKMTISKSHWTKILVQYNACLKYWTQSNLSKWPPCVKWPPRSDHLESEMWLPCKSPKLSRAAKLLEEKFIYNL